MEAIDDLAGEHSILSVVRRWIVLPQSFCVASVALFLLMAAMLPLVQNGYIALPDEGVYLAQAAALAHGSWKTDRPITNLIKDDAPESWSFDPLGPALITNDQRVPYARHPLYSSTLGMSYRLLGQLGPLLISTIGGYVASILIGLLCRAFDPIFGVPGLLLAGLSSPLLFNSYIVSAHSWAVCLSAGLTLAIIHSLMHRRIASYAVVTVVSVLLPMLRTEGVVLITAIVISLAIAVLPRVHRPRQPRTHAVILAGLVGLGGSVGWMIDLNWAQRIRSLAGTVYAEPGAAILGKQTELLRGAWIALLQPWGSAERATVLVPLTLALVIACLVIARFAPSRPAIAALLGGFAALSSVGALVTNDWKVTGLVAAWPILLFSLFGFRVRMLNDVRLGFLTTTTVVGLILLILTIYGDGGSSQWGGRLFQILLPPLIPLMLIGMENLSIHLTASQMKSGVASISVIALCFGLMSIRYNLSSRDEMKGIVTGAVERIHDTQGYLVKRDIDGRLVTVISPVRTDGVGRAFWQIDAEYNLIRIPFPVFGLTLPFFDFEDGDAVLLLTDAPDLIVAMLADRLTNSTDLNVHKFEQDRQLWSGAIVMYSGTVGKD